MSNLELVSSKSERRVARSVVAGYHDVFQCSRAAKELWKFCNYLQVEVAAAMIREQPPNDWWERGPPRER